MGIATWQPPEHHVLLCEVKYGLRVTHAGGKETGEGKEEETLQWPQPHLLSLIEYRRVSQGMATEETSIDAVRM
jgi:hypothetical protein